MKTATLSLGDHVAYKSSRNIPAREAIVTNFRDRSYFNGADTIGLTWANVPEGSEPGHEFWVRPQEVVSTWAGEVTRRRESEKALAEHHARMEATVAANEPRLKAVEGILLILKGGYEPSGWERSQLLKGGGVTVRIDITRLENLASALQAMST